MAHVVLRAATCVRSRRPRAPGARTSCRPSGFRVRLLAADRAPQDHPADHAGQSTDHLLFLVLGRPAPAASEAMPSSTGLAAPFVGAGLARRRPGPPAWATAWNTFGIADLIVAPAAARALRERRWSPCIPWRSCHCSSGRPSGFLTHIWSLRNLSTAAGAGREARRSTPVGEPVGAT